MDAIDLRLDDNMKAVRVIPRMSQRQEKEYDYPAFAYISYDIRMSEFLGRHVHLHFHDSFHLVEVLTGEINMRTGTGVKLLTPGTVCFINVNVIHGFEPVSAPEDCRLRAYVFHPALLSGNWESPMGVKYVHPIQNNPGIHAVVFSPEESGRLRELLEETRAIHSAKAFGYEFDVRYHLTLIWRQLLTDLPSQLKSTEPLDDRLRQRMRTMLNFIRTNYDRKIDLDEIAESALISQRECFRCFKRTLGVTPNQYLQNYRVRLSARMLLESDDSISDIAMACGFSDTSYYGKTFQKYMECSPSEYRKRHSSQYTPVE